MQIAPRQGDALIIVDVQRDFLPDGALAVPDGDSVVPPLNRYTAIFEQRGLPVFATRDWHPARHCSFREQGGRWPLHCVAGTRGAEFADGLELPSSVIVISKATRDDHEAYSGFEETSLEASLRELAVNRLWVGGLATDYCVRQTVLDALARDFGVLVLSDAIRPVDAQAGDGRRAEQEMFEHGAISMEWSGVDR